MSSTKIINVLKDDSFSEILELFKATPAEEVIFVLPKRSKAFQKEEHFVTLREQTKELGKRVSFLCSNPEINDLAQKHRFDVLLARSPVPRKKSNSVNIVNEIEEFYAEPAIAGEEAESISTFNPRAQEDEEFDESPAQEYVPVTAKSSPRLSDMFVPETDDQHSVRVSGKQEREMPVEVNTMEYDDAEHHAAEDIKSVWNSPIVSREDYSTSGSWAEWFRQAYNSRPKSKKPHERLVSATRPPRQQAHKTGLIALACLAVVVLGSVVFFSTGKAQVVIKPISTPLSLSLSVTASDNVATVDAGKMSLPGQVFNIQKEVSRSFPATGQVDVAQKAKGTITIYNELVTDQPLISTTRFESADHYIFHTLTTVTVPAGKTVNGKLLPGSINVQVIANKPGQEYNVAVGLFTIPAFKEKGDTNKFEKVYGQSTTEMRGGTSGKAVVVTDSDVTAAKQVLSALVTTNIQEDLKSQLNNLIVINDGQVVVGDVTSGPVDAIVNTFTANLGGSLKTVGFKKEDLDSLIAQYIDSHNNMTVLADKLTLSYENARWDDSKSALVFTVKINGTAYQKVDSQKVISELLGKNDTQIKAYLSGVSGVSSANVSLSPFWVRSIPKNQEKVKVEMSY